MDIESDSKCGESGCKRLYAMERRAAVGRCFFSCLRIGSLPLVVAAFGYFSKAKGDNRFSHHAKHGSCVFNWILFSGMIEAFLCKYNLPYDPVRIEYAVREFANEWYVGDGYFSDGMDFHLDYYNSIAIHPYLAAIVDVINKANKRYAWYAPKLDAINKRYAEILERDINTDGSYPVTGRSITYRCGVFHHLADMAFRKDLPESFPPAKVRSALTAVIKKTLEAQGTFNKDGWLNIGLYGSQPNLGEFYITTGSLYLCAGVFLPLGLPETDEFWSAPAVPWTSVKYGAEKMCLQTMRWICLKRT